MGVGISGRGIVSCRDLDDKGVREELAGKSHKLYSRETDIRTLYR